MADEPVARVSVSYGTKKPSDPSNTFAGSQEAHVSYSVEFSTVGMTMEQIKKRLADLHKEYDAGVKLAVAASLDVGFVTGEDGYIRLTPVTVPTVPHTSAPQPARRPSGGGQRGGGQQFAPPKADASTLPILMLDYFKSGTPIAFHDCRQLKADGVYKPNAADLRSVDKFTNQAGGQAQIPVWLHDKDGNPNTWEMSLVAAAEGSPAADGSVF